MSKKTTIYVAHRPLFDADIVAIGTIERVISHTGTCSINGEKRRVHRAIIINMGEVPFVFVDTPPRDLVRLDKGESSGEHSPMDEPTHGPHGEGCTCTCDDVRHNTIVLTRAATMLAAAHKIDLEVASDLNVGITNSIAVCKVFVQSFLSGSPNPDLAPVLPVGQGDARDRLWPAGARLGVEHA